MRLAVGEGTWPLTGRLDEMDRIRTSLGGADPHSLMLVGPAGVGKTRLAREAQRLATEAGRDAVWLSATHSIARTPLGVFAPLLPAQQVPDVGDLLTRSARALLDRPRAGGLVLLVDDAHLLDDLSAGLIHQLAATHGVHVVLTVRAGEAVPEPITALWKDDVVRRVELGRLDPAAVRDLLTAVLGGQVDPEAVRVLAHRCAGNALLLRELTLSALAAGVLARDLGLWRLVGALAPSDRIVELMGARLEGLDDTAVRLLEGVAYAEPLGSAELAHLAAPGLVDRLQWQGLLTSSLVGRRVEVRLAHPLVGEVVRSRTSAVRVAEMARTLADLTERAGARRAEDALRLGMWRLDGGGGSPAVMLRAAASARWHYDFVLAERLARAAGGFEGGLLAAQAVALQGRSAEAAREYAALQPSCDDERVRLAIAHIDLLWLCLGAMEEGLRVAERAEAAIEDPVLRGAVSAKRAGVVLGSHGPGPAAVISVPLLAVTQGPSLVFSSLVSSFSLGRQGLLDDAIAAADLGYRTACSLTEPDDWYPWFLTHSRCEALAYAGRFADAEALALEQYQEGLDAGSGEARAWFLWHLSRARLERGQVESAARDAREAVALLSSLGRLGVQHSMLSLLAKALAVAGDHAGAQGALDTIAALGIDQPRWSWTEFLGAHAWTAVAAGRHASARKTLRTAADIGQEVGDLTGALGALHDLARLGEARFVLDRLTALAAGMDGALVAARVRHVRALATDDAAGLAGAAGDFAVLGADLLAAEAAAAASASWRGAGDVRRADAELRRAGLLLSACERVRTPALLALAEPDRLTVAERETALLAARGRTSKQIAEELVLSVRTVENRLQRVYQKLGIRKRAELADLIG